MMDWKSMLFIMLILLCLIGCEKKVKMEPAADRSSDMIPPEIIKKVLPEYPEQARTEGIWGAVKLEAVIGLDGKAHDIKIIQSLPYMDEVVIEAVKQWEFKPAVRHGRPIETSFMFCMNIPEKR